MAIIFKEEIEEIKTKIEKQIDDLLFAKVLKDNPQEVIDRVEETLMEINTIICEYFDGSSFEEVPRKFNVVSIEEEPENEIQQFNIPMALRRIENQMDLLFSKSKALIKGQKKIVEMLSD